MMIIVLTFLFGVTMKIADLLNEHGLKLFNGANIIFGILWGVFGAWAISFDNDIANIILAMILAFILRMRIDYRNHAIASIIIIVSFLTYCDFVKEIFFFFFLFFITFGTAKDLLDDYYKSNNIFKKISETGWYYIVSSLIYSLYVNNYLSLIVLSTYILSYNLIKYCYEYKCQ